MELKQPKQILLDDLYWRMGELLKSLEKEASDLLLRDDLSIPEKDDLTDASEELKKILANYKWNSK